ncbi:AraC family transcriptional regulator [Halanaerobium salsuginis]|jgi:YesN/AraC family two-component response regulator|uniref:AraC-like ligand binding domain-containing protein n=1 Tax=Halanaerobium salsuginis TaxID=29563 RepID=A0A1I4HVL7_9FIRM|nr:helix-turn-helix domain-containing protein [Halanaerobium salsuginis]SFL46202.1 AraC-like ligand binding domain-containing protein [Halanaerobium salsuginis]
MVCKAEVLQEELSFEKKHLISDNGMKTVHYHNAYEIYYLKEGHRVYDIKNKTFKVKEGNLILIDKYKQHKTFNEGNQSFNRMLIKFKESSLGSFVHEDYNLLSSFTKNINIIQFDSQARIIIENIFAKMEMENNSAQPGQNIYLKTLLIELLIYINRYLSGKETSEAENKYHIKIIEIMKYIDQNYYRNLSLSNLADQFSYSSSYLSHLFKEKSDYTITEYINNTRIKAAQNLLLNSQQNITQIAEKVGYNNLVHFGRTFKKITGFTPTEYKKCYLYN